MSWKNFKSIDILFFFAFYSRPSDEKVRGFKPVCIYYKKFSTNFDSGLEDFVPTFW